MNLEVISPEKVIYSGEADSVTLPGAAGLFTVLNHHAPIISVLKKGTLTYKVGDDERMLEIESGFVEVKQNVVSVAIEQTGK
ncbi:MAG: ATP synthase F1 subunit epsilon [Dysgonamonadaceae bacterium]|jgi:F-type H+-transporting ATPase subunit epsilon|nr:ATP synthase F1 subunit epsilon [Dysgonamonadaceae bacterium]